MNDSIDIKEFSPRKATRMLRESIVDHLMKTNQRPGSPFLTDAEWVKKTGLSRSTVRRALDLLQKEGWIERRAGLGSFVGQRAALSEGMRSPVMTSASSSQRRMVRMAILVFELGDLAHDWYTPLLMEGVDSAAEDTGVVVELLGSHDRDIDVISRRMAQSRPDVLVCLSADPRQAFVVRDAQKLGIPCLCAGTPHIGLGLPGVCEDNRQGIRIAVERLHAKGHRRIGLAMQRCTQRWAFDRHEAYHEALKDLGLEADEQYVHWMPMDEPREGNPETTARLAAFLKSAEPTGLILGNFTAMLHLHRLVTAGGLQVPRDLSVVSFEQNLRSGQWLAGVDPATVRLPFKAMGRRLAMMARTLAEGGSLSGVEYFPCDWKEAGSISEPARARKGSCLKHA